MSTHFRTWILGLFLLLPWGCTGCATGFQGVVYHSTAWEKTHGSAGKVLLIVCGDPQNGPSKERTQEIYRVAVESLRQIAGTTVINDPNSPAAMSQGIGDHEALELGKSRGADSVCVLTIGNYSGYFAIMALPPSWETRTQIVYSLRVIDVRTGDLLTNSVIARHSGGPFAVLSVDDLQKNLRQQLHHDLTSTVAASF